MYFSQMFLHQILLKLFFTLKMYKDDGNSVGLTDTEQYLLNQQSLRDIKVSFRDHFKLDCCPKLISFNVKPIITFESFNKIS